jgi:hypothetical protein
MDRLGFLNFIRPLSLPGFGLAALLFLLSTGQALASRVVYFDSAGSSQTFNSDELSSTFQASCTVAITNSGVTSQTVNMIFTHEVVTSTLPAATTMNTGAPNAGLAGGLVGGGSMALGTDVTLVAGARVFYTWNFPALIPKTPAQQDIRCLGKITVYDTAAATPGFVSATGLMVTWMQSPPPKAAVTVLRAPTSLNTTTITIGEGRPF